MPITALFQARNAFLQRLHRAGDRGQLLGEQDQVLEPAVDRIRRSRDGLIHGDDVAAAIAKITRQPLQDRS